MTRKEIKLVICDYPEEDRRRMSNVTPGNVHATFVVVEGQ
jgi:hypothetical protein